MRLHTRDTFVEAAIKSTLAPKCFWTGRIAGESRQMTRSIMKRSRDIDILTHKSGGNYVSQRVKSSTLCVDVKKLRFNFREDLLVSVYLIQKLSKGLLQ